MRHIEAGLALVRMTFDDLQDAAGYVCTKNDFESANGDDEDEEEDEEEEKKKEKDEEDEDDEDEDDEDDGAIRSLPSCRGGYGKAPRQTRISQCAPARARGIRLCAPHPCLDRSGDSRPGKHSH